MRNEQEIEHGRGEAKKRGKILLSKISVLSALPWGRRDMIGMTHDMDTVNDAALKLNDCWIMESCLLHSRGEVNFN